MSRLNKFMGKPKVIKIGDEDLELRPLKLKDLDLLLDMQDDKKRNESMKKIIRKTLKESVPDATDEEVDNFTMSYFEELLTGILEVNNLNKNVPQKKS